jgi:hypothetical protein
VFFYDTQRRQESTEISGRSLGYAGLAEKARIPESTKQHQESWRKGKSSSRCRGFRVESRTYPSIGVANPTSMGFCGPARIQEEKAMRPCDGVAPDCPCDVKLYWEVAFLRSCRCDYRRAMPGPPSRSLSLLVRQPSYHCSRLASRSSPRHSPKTASLRRRKSQCSSLYGSAKPQGN